LSALIEVPELLEMRHGDCGCPEEEWLFLGFNLIIHHEPTGETDGFLDGGDCGEAEISVRAATALGGRAAIFAWANALIMGAAT
jgi:hypothetical protein